jgi:hypothetical protein
VCSLLPGKTMALLYKTVLVGQVWLTAIMTLIAGIPQFSCICRNGGTKPVCVSLATDTPGCCCGGGNCCSPSPGRSGCCRNPAKAANTDQPTHKSCCAERGDQNPDLQQGVQLNAGQKCCTKTLTPPQVTAVSYHKTVVERDASFLALIPQSVTLSPPSLATAKGPTLWQISLVVPPTDLVDLLQHYLI